jgi:hypothetical protein
MPSNSETTDEEIAERILAAEPDEYDECRDWIPVLAKAYAAGRAAERSRCAKIVEEWPEGLGIHARDQIIEEILGGET